MSLCFSVHFDELLVVIDNVLYGIYPHCLDCFHGCCLCSFDACWYKGQGRSMLLLFFSRKAVTNMWCRMPAPLHCARVSPSLLSAQVFLSLLRVSTSQLEVHTHSSMVNSRASSSLAATNALYTSEIDFIRDIEHGWCNKGRLDATLQMGWLLFPQLPGPTLATMGGLTEPVLSLALPRQIGLTTYILSSFSVLYFDNECFVLLIQTVLGNLDFRLSRGWSGGTTYFDPAVELNCTSYGLNRTLVSQDLDGWHSCGMHYLERLLISEIELLFCFRPDFRPLVSPTTQLEPDIPYLGTTFG